MGTKAVVVDMAPSDGVKHVRGFNGALQLVEGHKTDALLGEATKWILIPDVLYVPGVQANMLSAGQLKESGVQLKGDGDEMLLVAATGGVLGRARYTGRVLCTDLCPCSMQSQSTELLTEKKPDLTLARVWGCMVQFMVPEQQQGGKLAPKARWGLHLGVSPESKGWEVLDLTDNKVVTSVEVIFYETQSLEVWKAKFGPASRRTQAHPPTDTTMATVPLLAEVDELADEDVVEVLPPSPILAPPFPVADRPAWTLVSATGNEGSLEALLVASPAVDKAPSSSTRMGSRRRQGSRELSAEEESIDNDVVEVSITKPELRRTGRTRRPPERLSFHACPPPADFTTVYDEVDDAEDEELPELDPDMHADPERHWDISTMTVKEAMASWKGEAVKAAMEEEIRSLIGMGT
ncbi:unnamed protein product [Closterium sp. NIES-54]